MVDGPNQYSGRIEIYNSHIYRYYSRYNFLLYHWGTISDNSQWTLQDATVLCRSLGYQFDKENLPLNQSYGLTTGPVWLSYVSCSGNEHYTWDCSYSFNYRNSYDHSADIGIVCSGILHTYVHMHVYN